MSENPPLSEENESPPAPLRVWGIGTPRTFRVHWMMEELGLSYDLCPILTRSDEMRSDAFRALSHREKIPMLEHGSLVLGESAAISLYLADAYRRKADLAPAPGTRERATHDELCFFVMTEMDALLYVLRRHEGLPEIYGESAAACEAARAYFLRSLGELDRRLTASPGLLHGDHFSVADVLAYSCLLWARVVGIAIPSTFDAYSDRIQSRPALARATATNFPPEALAALGVKPLS